MRRLIRFNDDPDRSLFLSDTYYVKHSWITGAETFPLAAKPYILNKPHWLFPRVFGEPNKSSDLLSDSVIFNNVYHKLIVRDNGPVSCISLTQENSSPLYLCVHSHAIGSYHHISSKNKTISGRSPFLNTIDSIQKYYFENYPSSFRIILLAISIGDGLCLIFPHQIIFVRNQKKFTDLLLKESINNCIAVSDDSDLSLDILLHYVEIKDILGIIDFDQSQNNLAILTNIGLYKKSFFLKAARFAFKFDHTLIPEYYKIGLSQDDVIRYDTIEDFIDEEI